MKRVLSVLVALLLMTGFAIADDAVAPAPEIQLSVDGYTDIVLERELKSNAGLVEELEQNWYGAKLNVKIHDIITLSPFVAGVGQIEGTNGLAGKVTTDSALGLGMEARVDVPLELPVDIAVLGMYRTFETEIDEIGAAPGLAIMNNEVNYDEWAVELQLSKDIELSAVSDNLPGVLTPIIGVRYSDVRVDSLPAIGGVLVDFDAEADDNVGITVGAMYAFNDSVGVSVKGKLIDQTAIEIAGTIRF